jgi:anaerobic selenocysteine-containing dehydrogenase
VSNARNLLWARSGRRTDELARGPSRLGLPQVPQRLAPTAAAALVCGYCSTGCSLDVHLRDGVAVNLSPTVDYPVNIGAACPKGWEALTPLLAPDRLTTPMLRNGRGKLEPVDWATALDVMCDRFKDLKARFGDESVAFLSTGQITTEEMALLGSLFKFGMGFRHGDGNTRQCMATSVVAYKQAFGYDAPPYTYADFEQSDVVVLIGSNLAVAHPIMWQRLQRNPHDPAIVVIDPRATETAQAATHHLALAPKSDLTLLYGLAAELIRVGAVDHEFVRAHTGGYTEFALHVAGYTPERVSAATGLSVEQLCETAALIAGGERVSFWWTMGVNQSHEGVRTAQAIINLALMTGNIGRPGTGANSITGQCNAMGSRLFSNTTGLLGGRDFADPEHRTQVATILGVDASVIPVAASKAYDQIIEDISIGTTRALWVIATNSAHSWINQSDCHDLLDRLDFLVVQDLYADTETAQRADLVLPAAGWGEKDGTFINSERRIGPIRRVLPAPGQALADFWIFRAVADHWGCGDMFERWSSPEATFRILAELSAGMPCDFTGIDGYAALDAEGGVQWPRPATGGQLGRERRLFEDGEFCTPDGRARFVFDTPRAPAEPPDAKYPLVLLTGRGSTSQWHTQTRTGRSDVLRELYPHDCYVEVHPDDAATLGLASGDVVRVESRRGSLDATTFVTAVVQPGHVFVPMHYATTNQLTYPAVDPHSRQPSYKYCAVRIRKPEHWEPPATNGV